MRSKFSSEQVRPFMLALIIVGVIGLVYGGYRFADASLRIQNNQAYQIKAGIVKLTPDNQPDTATLFAAESEYRDLQAQRNEALLFLGAGLVLVCGGWLGGDLIRWRAKRMVVQRQE